MRSLTIFARDERGQALVELGLFLPIILIALIGIIFFSRLGILSERAQSAVRYGGEVSFRQGNAYSVATVYNLIDELLNISPSGSELGPLCLRNDASGASGAAARISQDTVAALTLEQQVGPTPFPGSGTLSIWKPDAGHTTSGGCNPASVNLQTSSSSPVIPVSVTGVTLMTGLDIPTNLSFVQNGSITAHMGFLQIATPNLITACTPAGQVVLKVLNPNVGTPSCSLASTVPPGL